MQRGQKFAHPRVDLLVGLREQTVLLATDQIGQREVVLFAIRMLENHLIMRRLYGFAFYLGVTQIQSERPESLDEDMVFVLEGFEDVGDHRFKV